MGAFRRGDRKLDVMRPHLDRLARAGRTGVAAIGVAQEFQRVFTGTTHRAEGGGAPHFTYAKADRRVTAYYFYVLDEVFGPAFVKICAYFPYPIKIWLNGHEYAKRAATRAGIDFTALANGFGKSHMLISLGIAAEAGHRVRYFTAADLVETLYRGLADNSVGKVIDTLLRNDLILLDELGFAPWTTPAPSCCSGSSPPATNAAPSGSGRTGPSSPGDGSCPNTPPASAC